MYAVVQTGSRTLRSASATKRRVCGSFWACTDGAPSVMTAAVAVAPRMICLRLMRPCPGMDIALPSGRVFYIELAGMGRQTMPPDVVSPRRSEGLLLAPLRRRATRHLRLLMGAKRTFRIRISRAGFDPERTSNIRLAWKLVSKGCGVPDRHHE